MITRIILLLSFFSVGCSTQLTREPQSDAVTDRLSLDMIPYETGAPIAGDVQLRAGFFRESRKIPLKACVIYLEGLGDSIRNHVPLFQKLADNGYRTLMFDYMGQGGSEGSMNHTRVDDPLLPGLQIGTQAKMLWEKSTACAKSKKIVIGWSTGGLAAYKLAKDQWADAVVLMAPGIHPRKFVGEAARDPSLLFSTESVITQNTLTRAKYLKGLDPHVDPIQPTSPTQVPLFASNLLLTSAVASMWKISPNIDGLVFLSGQEDTYVDGAATLKTLKANAPHFKVQVYDHALHELDNELPIVTEDLHQRLLSFLNQTISRKFHE